MVLVEEGSIMPSSRRYERKAGESGMMRDLRVEERYLELLSDNVTEIADCYTLCASIHMSNVGCAVW